MALRPLLAVACMLVVLLAVEYHVGVSREHALNQSIVPAAGTAGKSRSRPAVPAPDAAAAARQMEVVLARPLFTQSRRPVATALAGPSEPRLAGIIVGPSGRRAIFAGENDARGTVAAVGQDAGSWKVLAIEPDAVQVSGPDGPRTLRPSRGSGDPVGAAPPLPAHPSILDLLRARPLPFGGGGAPGSAVIPSPAAARAAIMGGR